MENRIKKTDAIAEMAELYKKQIAPRLFKVITNLENLDPGIKSEAIEKIMQKLDHLTNGGMVVLAGPIGCGKSVAALSAALIIRHATERMSFRSIQSRYVLDEPYTGFRGEISEFPGCLIIEDLGREHFTDRGYGISEWDYFFDYRYNMELPTIITTNLKPEEFVEKYNERIFDRLRECAAWINLMGKSLRG